MSSDWADEMARAWLERRIMGDVHIDRLIPSVAAELRAAYERGVREAVQACEGQRPDVDETGNGDEYRRGQWRGANDCAIVVRRLLLAPKAPTP